MIRMHAQMSGLPALLMRLKKHLRTVIDIL
jgi:hypothetical protein